MRNTKLQIYINEYRYKQNSSTTYNTFNPSYHYPTPPYTSTTKNLLFITSLRQNIFILFNYFYYYYMWSNPCTLSCLLKVT